jgi:hypothetical protein
VVRRAEALYALTAAKANQDGAQEFGVAGVREAKPSAAALAPGAGKTQGRVGLSFGHV